MTRTSDLEATMEQHRAEVATTLAENSKRLDKMQEMIEKNKAESDKQMSEVLQLLKALQPPTTTAAATSQLIPQPPPTFTTNTLSPPTMAMPASTIGTQPLIQSSGLVFDEQWFPILQFQEVNSSFSGLVATVENVENKINKTRERCGEGNAEKKKGVEEKHKQQGVRSRGVKPKPQQQNKVVNAKVFWKKFVIASSRTRKDGDGATLGGVSGHSWVNQKTQADKKLDHKVGFINLYDLGPSHCQPIRRQPQRMIWVPGIKKVCCNTLRTRCFWGAE